MLALGLSVKPAPLEVAALCRSVSALEAPSTSDGSMPLRANSVQLTDAD